MPQALSTLYDSDNPLSIPEGVDAAGYDDGYAASAWTAYGWARFPNALHITLYGKPSSDIFDIETGGGNPSQTPAWVNARNAINKLAIVYCNRSNGHLVEAELRGAGVQIGAVMLWVATDDGTEYVTVWNDGSPVYYPIWAVQYLNEANGSGGHYDLSLVYLAFGPIAGGQDLTDEQAAQLKTVYAILTGTSASGWLTALEWLQHNQAKIQAIIDAGPGGGGGLNATEAQQLSETHDRVVKDLAP